MASGARGWTDEAFFYAAGSCSRCASMDFSKVGADRNWSLAGVQRRREKMVANKLGDRAAMKRKL
jgi:hypothetical protein